MEFLKMPLTIAPQSVIILYKSNKNVYNLFVENYRTLMKEVRDYLNTWRGHIHRRESIFTEANVLYIGLLVECNSNQNTSRIFYRYRQADPKIYMKRQKTVLKKCQF